MHEDYCFKCGVWGRIDEASKLCRPCYDAWPYGRRPEPSGPRG